MPAIIAVSIWAEVLKRHKRRKRRRCVPGLAKSVLPPRLNPDACVHCIGAIPLSKLISSRLSIHL